MPTDKHSCIARAKSLLLTNTEESLRYAALELRLCVEALVYESLAAHSAMAHTEVIETWQPPQAVKALLEFEPRAETPYTLFAGVEKTPGVASEEMKFVGTCTPLRLGWLRKHYNKLGNLLHAPPPRGKRPLTLTESHAYLSEVIADLAEPLSGNLRGSGLRTVYSFSCSLCEKPVVCNVDAVAKSRRAVCFNPQCGVEYFAEPQDDGTAKFQPIVTEFDCVKCKAMTRIENRHLKIGSRFECQACRAKHVFVTCEWAYGLEDA